MSLSQNWPFKQMPAPETGYTNSESFQLTWNLNDDKWVRKRKNCQQITNAKLPLWVYTIRAECPRIQQSNVSIGGSEHDVSDKVSCREEHTIIPCILWRKTESSSRMLSPLACAFLKKGERGVGAGKEERLWETERGEEKRDWDEGDRGRERKRLRERKGERATEWEWERERYRERERERR